MEELKLQLSRDRAECLRNTLEDLLEQNDKYSRFDIVVSTESIEITPISDPIKIKLTTRN